MSILEIVIPTVLFIALVILRAEGMYVIVFILIYIYTHLFLQIGGEQLNPVYQNESTYPKDAYPVYFCKAMASAAQDGS